MPHQAYFLGYRVHRHSLCPLLRCSCRSLRPDCCRCLIRPTSWLHDAPPAGSTQGRLSWLGAQAYFFGYMIHRLLLVFLGRREQDDRDHYSNKRLDLGGPLLAQLFRQLFRKLQKDLRSHVQKAADRGRDVNIQVLRGVKRGGWDIALGMQAWRCGLLMASLGDHGSIPSHAASPCCAASPCRGATAPQCVGWGLSSLRVSLLKQQGLWAPVAVVVIGCLC